MKNYVKAILYAYPLLKTAEEDYAEHIKNKALLSYNSLMTAEQLSEYLAEEILRKRSLGWLKEKVEDILAKLSDAERCLLAIRYFGKKRKIKLPMKKQGEEQASPIAWSTSKYFRRQNKLLEKLQKLFEKAGVTQEVFCKRFEKVDMFQKLCRFIEQGRDQTISQEEKRWLRF